MVGPPPPLGQTPQQLLFPLPGSETSGSETDSDTIPNEEPAPPLWTRAACGLQTTFEAILVYRRKTAPVYVTGLFEFFLEMEESDTCYSCWRSTDTRLCLSNRCWRSADTGLRYRTAAGEARTQASVHRTAAGEARTQASVHRTAAGEARTPASIHRTAAGEARTPASIHRTAAGEARTPASIHQTAAGEARTQASVH